MGNYYQQILKEWHWDNISEAMDAASDSYKEWLADSTVSDSLKEDGHDFMSAHNRISVWAGIPQGAGFDFNNDQYVTMVYIGSVMNITPSGKFYMPWSTNITEKEADKDVAYRAAFDKIAAKFNMYLENGEGDPTDMFLVRYHEYV